jgi:hypothetical protein
VKSSTNSADDKDIQTDKEEKLLRLALDGAAQPGEYSNAATKWIESMRRRGITVETRFDAYLSPPEEPAEVEREPDPGLVRMPFGKHQGKRFCDVPRTYLYWIVNNVNNDFLVRAVTRYLRSGK